MRLPWRENRALGLKGLIQQQLRPKPEASGAESNVQSENMNLRGITLAGYNTPNFLYFS